MEDPRGIAWQDRCDYHSHMNAIRVAFAATYAQAIPNMRRAQYYRAKLPSMNQWIARKSEHEKVVHAAEEKEIAPEEEIPQPQIVQSTTQKNVVADDKGKTKKRKAQGGDTGAAMPKKKRTELQMLLRARGLGAEIDDSGVFADDDEEGDADISSGGLAEDIPPIASAVAINSVGLSPTELPPIATVTQPTKRDRTSIPPQASSINKKTRFSSRAQVSVVSSDSSSGAGSLKLPKPVKGAAKLSTSKKGGAGDRQEKKDREASYEILPYWPGTTEVIFDRYPALHKLAIVKRGKKRVSNSASRDVRKMPDMSRLIFLCRKASSTVGQNKAMKAGTENSVMSGSRQLIFLRRNLARSEARAEVGV